MQNVINKQPRDEIDTQLKIRSQKVTQKAPTDIHLVKTRLSQVILTHTYSSFVETPNSIHLLLKFRLLALKPIFNGLFQFHIGFVPG